MSQSSKKYGKLKFKIYDYDGEINGEFDWGSNRKDIFDRFYDADEIDDQDLAYKELLKITNDDPEFIDAYNSLGWWELNFYNYGNALNYFETAYRIGSKLIPKEFKGTILWGFLHNRPFLRAMHGLGLVYEYMGEYEKAVNIYDKVLKYNPNDNQGVRALAIETNLFMGNYKKILNICKFYPEDIMPDTLYGKFVAHYRLGQKDKAAEILKEANKTLPNVTRELLKEKHKKIESKRPGTITVGGEDEAYDYWHRTRVIWTDPELIRFIKINTPFENLN